MSTNAVQPAVYLGLGSNLGHREATLDEALRLLDERGLGVRRVSSLYLTEPVGGPPQDWFVNAVAAGVTSLGAAELLEACLGVERALGRVRQARNGPRTLDLDLLLYGEATIERPGLVVPHPRLHERRFVLVPLAEIAPGLRHPRLGLTAAELRDRCPDPSRVVRLDRQALKPA
jgi:2-amino-4-hydroxy-6-hydroxymethyldihydropteridine diphosphokinase